jgi:hypothetical protein
MSRKTILSTFHILPPNSSTMRAISNQQHNRIISLLESGETIREVSQKFRVSLGAVSNIGKMECLSRICSRIEG